MFRRIKNPLVRGIALALSAAMLLLGIGVLLLRSDSARAWMYSATGEENAWEGAKGTLRLAWLEVTGPHPVLEPDAPMEHLGGSPYGVNTFLQLEADPDMVRESFEIMNEAGIGWARQHFPWEDIEIHASGDFEDRRNEPYRSAWDKYDRIVSLSHDYSVELLARLDDPPDWAYAESADGPVYHKGPPDDFADYGAYVAAVGERYCGLVRYYQLWNEPNIYPEWGEADVDPAGYAELLRVGAEALRAACPDAVVVSAAMAQTTEPGGKNMDDLNYLRALYDAGWQDSFDVLAVQAFGLWTGPTDRRVHPSLTNFNRLLLARDIMVENGDAEKAMWISEMGWNSAPDDIEAVYGRVSEDNRARYTRGAYERIAEEWPFVGPTFLWFLRRPNEEWHPRPEGWFRIVDPDWSETPTYNAMKELGGRTPVMHRGRHEVDDQAIAYFGPWRAVPPSPEHPDLQIGAVGSELNIVFQGTGYRLQIEPRPLPEVQEVAEEDDQGEGSESDGADGQSDETSDSGTNDEAGSADTNDEATGADAESADDSDESQEPADPILTEFFVVLDGVAETIILDADQTMIEVLDLDEGQHTLVTRVDAGELALDEIFIQAPDPISGLRPFWWVLGVLVALDLAFAVFLLRRWRRTRAR